MGHAVGDSGVDCVPVSRFIVVSALLVSSAAAIPALTRVVVLGGVADLLGRIVLGGPCLPLPYGIK